MSAGFKISKSAEPLLYEKKIFSVSKTDTSAVFPFGITLTDNFFLSGGFLYIVKADPTVGNAKLYTLKPFIEDIKDKSLKLGLSEDPFAGESTLLEFTVYRIPLVFSLKSVGIFSF